MEALIPNGVKPEEVGRADRWLLGFSLVGTMLIPIGVGVFEGTMLHLIAAGTAIVAGSAFLWKTRGRATHGKLLVALAIGVSATWLVGVTWLAISFGRTMEGFN
jgi:hypothetical protein